MASDLYRSVNALHFELGLLLQHEDTMNEQVLIRLLTEVLEGVKSGQAKEEGLTEVPRVAQA